MNFEGMRGFTRDFPTGGLKLMRLIATVQWGSLDDYLKDNKSCYELLKFSVYDIFSSLVLSTAFEHEVDFNLYAEEENVSLQKIYAQDYLESCNFNKYDSCSEQLINRVMLDKKRFPALSEDDISKLVDVRYSELRRLNSIHKIYTFRIALAKREVIKWDDDLSIQLHYEKEGWSGLSGFDLQEALNKNLSLLSELKNDIKATHPVADSYVSKSLWNKLLAEINMEYAEEVLKFANECTKAKIIRYNQCIDFVNILSKRVVQSQAAGVKCFPKKHQLSVEWLPQSVQENQPRLKSRLKPLLLEKLSQLNDRGRIRRLGGSINGLSRIFMGGALFFALVTGQASLKNR